MAKQKPKKKKKKRKDIPSHAKAHVTATFNNTIVTVTEPDGSVLTWGSTGTAGYKGTRQSTPFAATSAVQEVADKVKALGVKSLDIYVKGAGLGRDAAVRALKSAGLEITSITDVTPIPHNGCRPKKRRRV